MQKSTHLNNDLKTQVPTTLSLGNIATAKSKFKHRKDSSKHTLMDDYVFQQ